MIDRLLLRLLALGGIVVAFGIVVIFAGHGAAPVALLMVLGSPRAWLSSQLPGWLGLLVSLAALFARTEPAYRSIRFWGAFLLVASVSVFIAHSEVMFLSVITATPLLGVAVYCLWRYLASRRTSPGVSDRPRQIAWAVAALAVSLAIEAMFLLPMFVGETLVREEVIEIVQFVALIVLTRQVWIGHDWARWAVVVLIVANRVIYAAPLLRMLREPSLMTVVTGSCSTSRSSPSC